MPDRRRAPVPALLGGCLLLALALFPAGSDAFQLPGPFKQPQQRQRHHARQRLQATPRQQQGQQVQDRRGALAQGARAGAMLSALGLGIFAGPARPTFAQVPPLTSGGKAGATPKTIVITGANSGIGLDATQKLAAQGHQVYVVRS